VENDIKIRHPVTLRHPVSPFWVLLTSRNEIRVLQCVAVCRSVWSCKRTCAIHTSRDTMSVLQCAAVCCSVCCSVLQCVAECCSVLQFQRYLHLGQSIRVEIQRVCCSVLQCVTWCCSVLQVSCGSCHIHMGHVTFV